jgi:hypothetical protein
MVRRRETAVVRDYENSQKLLESGKYLTQYSGRNVTLP